MPLGITIGAIFPFRSSISADTEPVNWHDLTDGAGHGVLVATDNIFLTLQTAATVVGASATITAATGFGECAILYRFKEVGLAEYIGIVQSQQ